MMAIRNIMTDYESNMELSGSEETPEVVPEATPEATPTPEEPAEETPKEEVPAEAAPAETPEEPMLYETPDGRKVDAETLQKEWKDNFLPEFTRKSQQLADIEREKLNNTPKDEPKWKDAEYVPETYAEVIQIAKAEALDQIKADQQAATDRDASIKDAVEKELSEIKATDANLDENALYAHANKYGFQSLKTAHVNMLDMKKTAIDVEARTVKNIKTREADPISTGTGGELPDSSGYDPAEMSQFDGAAEYLSHLKGK